MLNSVPLNIRTDLPVDVPLQVSWQQKCQNVSWAVACYWLKKLGEMLDDVIIMLTQNDYTRFPIVAIAVWRIL